MPFGFLKIAGRTILVRLILFSILISMVTIFASSYFTYNYFSSSFKDEISDFNHRVLNQLSIASDEFILRNINEMALNLAADDPYYSDILSIFDDNIYDNPDWIFNAHQQLKSLALSNRDIVDSIFVHSRNNKLLVSSNFMKYIDEKETAEYLDFNWINQFYESQSSIIWRETRNARVYSEIQGWGDIITVVCSYPLSSTGDDVQGCISVNIKEEALNNYLTKFNSINSAQLMIIDNNGTIISHSDNSQLYSDVHKELFVQKILNDSTQQDFKAFVSKTEYWVSFTKSSYNNWYYVSLVPIELFYEKNYRIKVNIIVISAVILFIVFMLSNLLSFKIYLPFRRILDKHSSSSLRALPAKNINEYKMLDNIFTDMSTKINDLQLTLDRHSQMIRHNFFNDLLSPRKKDKEKLESILNLVNVNFTRELFQVIHFNINKPVENANAADSIHLSKYNIIDFIKSISAPNYSCYPVDIGGSAIAIVVNIDDSNSFESVKQFVEYSMHFCFKRFDVLLSVGTGRIVNSFLELNQSFLDAKICSQYKFLKPDQNKFLYEDINDLYNNNKIALSSDLLCKLDKNLNLGNINEIQRILASYISNVQSEYVSYRQVRKDICMLFNTFKSYLLSMGLSLDEVTDENLKLRLQQPDNINEFIKNLEQVAQNTFDCISNKKVNHNSELIEVIKKYVMDNLHQEISLITSADVVHISPNYLSKIFKNETGTNYIDYVVSRKMDKAIELLSTTNLSIDQITRQVGYTHSAYFCRKFKEFSGKTPNEYRNEALSTNA